MTVTSSNFPHVYGTYPAALAAYADFLTLKTHYKCNILNIFTLKWDKSVWITFISREGSSPLLIRGGKLNSWTNGHDCWITAPFLIMMNPELPTFATWRVCIFQIFRRLITALKQLWSYGSIKLFTLEREVTTFKRVGEEKNLAMMYQQLTKKTILNNMHIRWSYR